MVAGVPGRTEVEIEKTSRHLHRAFGCHVVPGQSTAMPIPGKRDQTRLTAVVLSVYPSNEGFAAIGLKWKSQIGSASFVPKCFRKEAGPAVSLE
ncbi:hypothetical protein PCASD_00768 [Puccinia coronata f. sp. avenae]|uniref:Uncharacterized protein n=1 Tax=Puccinia coronata f. sp. avenae TaxID=200324 RepID=A0A2N5UAY2_9BASI|nr:hypothetical protein PCASD_14765 [Puccinia coronata f. sp. avenae]PLW50764.1 hypothetical protein PCASD_00768 [Puccinia coronata f. sp. avenae]